MLDFESMNIKLIKKQLAPNPGPHAWALQDIDRWPDNTDIEFVERPDFAYLLRSGHPLAEDRIWVDHGRASKP